MIRPTLLALAASALAVLPASAARPSYADLMSLRSACKTDIAALCSGTARGHGQLAQCVADHASQLSAGCHDALTSFQQKRAAASSLDTD